MTTKIYISRTLHAAALFTAILFMTAQIADAKIYIDITNPAPKKLPIAIYDLQGPSGKEIAEVVREDMIFTGLFTYIDKASYVESPTPQFSPQNWTPLGIEAVVKGSVVEDGGLAVSVTLYDPFEAKEVLNKQYRGNKDQARPLGHEIAGDIYTALTGKKGIFRTRIAFVGEDEGEKGIYIMDWDGHKITKLGLRGTLVLTPHWSSDGSKLLYSSERSRQWGIYLLNFQKMTERKIFSARGVNMAGDFFPDGDAFAFSSSQDGTPELYVYSLASNTTKKLTRSFGINVSPAVSPEGGMVAFVSDRGGNPQIYVMRSDGSDVRRVTFEGSYNTSPCWSPSGDRIVFSGRKGGKNQIFIVRPDGSDIVQLTDRGNNEDPSFSPDGRYIVFSSDRDKTKGVYIMRANGEAQRRISPKDLKSFGPRWSPN